MAANSEIHNDAQRMILLAPLTIGAAVGATATVPVVRMSGMTYLTVYAAFLYGAGGTDAIARVQTSIDGGLSWLDIMSFGFLTAASNKVAAVQAYVANAVSVVPTLTTDGSLAVNTVNQGILGDRLRVKYVTTGTYSGATSLAVYALAKG